MLANIQEKYSETLSKIKEETDKSKKNTEISKSYSLFSEGLKYYNEKNYDIAIEKFTEVIRLNPSYADAYLNRGNLYKAEKNIDIALSIDKNNVSALMNKGEIYIYRYEIEKNIKLLKDAKNYLEESEKVNIAKIINIEETYYYYSLLYEKFSKVKNTSKKEKDEYKKLSKDYLIKSAKLGYNKAREKCKKYKDRF